MEPLTPGAFAEVLRQGGGAEGTLAVPNSRFACTIPWGSGRHASWLLDEFPEISQASDAADPRR